MQWRADPSFFRSSGASYEASTVGLPYSSCGIFIYKIDLEKQKSKVDESKNRKIRNMAFDSSHITNLCWCGQRSFPNSTSRHSGPFSLSCNTTRTNAKNPIQRNKILKKGAREFYKKTPWHLFSPRLVVCC